MKVSDSSERRANAQLPEWSNGIGCNPIQSGVRISYWAQANNQKQLYYEPKSYGTVRENVQRKIRIGNI